uniref:Uncharacterized protein n=1 Tax=Bradyrhizobium diazoefficiens TaxID=1355477 RepID=A0A810AWR0_9BRAD|nr:hypothetical protein XF6B_71010 [Bradyrhizobium diazoefficiens]
MLTVAAEGDRGLGSQELIADGTGRAATFAATIPLRHSAASPGAQDDDAKHDPSPGGNVARWISGRHEIYLPEMHRDRKTS